MYRVLKREVLAPNIVYIEIEAPHVARVARPGQFVILRVDERGERFPMSLADWDREKGSIGIAFMVLGTSTMKLSMLKEGDVVLDVAGPLGNPVEVKEYGTVLIACGCFGIGPACKIAEAMRSKGNRVISVMEARSSSFLFWEDRLRAVSDEFHVVVGDGSSKKKLWTEGFIKNCIESGERPDVIFAYGCNFMMKQCSEASKPFGVKTYVFLTAIMVDGTGMCGACRVMVGGETKFACVDGPMFDGHQVDWDNLASRLTSYLSKENISFSLFERESWHRFLDLTPSSHVFFEGSKGGLQCLR